MHCLTCKNDLWVVNLAAGVANAEKINCVEAGNVVATDTGDNGVFSVNIVGEGGNITSYTYL